jgi:hypothetical protein
LPYKKRSGSQYGIQKRRNAAVATMNTKKWGKISYPKGTNPVLVEMKTDGTTSQIEGLGFKKDSDIDSLTEALKKKSENELEQYQKATFTINFPKTRKKPVKFSAVGEQPITPPIIHHSAWPPDERLIEEIKEEMRKNPNRKTASDLEAMTYLNTASSAAPMSEQWNRIYFYLTRNYLKRKGWKKFDGGMDFLDHHKTLSEYDRRQLNELKNQIFRDQQKALRERRKQAKKLRGEK